MSLKLRLTLIILLPLLLIASLVGYWAYNNTRDQASERFDSSLMSTARAIANDIERSEGDALSLRTRDLIDDTSGGRVFYHVYAPDGVFITGYATPPVSPNLADQSPLEYYDAVYHRQAVRVLSFREAMQIDGLQGDFNFTVWQNTKVRDLFVRNQARQTNTVITILTLSVGLIVWVGVSIGLRPLIDLQHAISIRTSSDLTPIRRRVPAEVKGIVATLNSLFEQVENSLRTKNDFISNAAHQIRNPVAGVLAMAEAVKSAPDAESVLSRTDDLYIAAKETSALANKLLRFDRASRVDSTIKRDRIDIIELVDTAVSKVRTRTPETVKIMWYPTGNAIFVHGDGLMIGEAILNLIDNALIHGGSGLNLVEVTVTQKAAFVEIQVMDNGVGIPDELQAIALERFGQIFPGQGSGMGLSIVQAVARSHHGKFEFVKLSKNLAARLTLPASHA